MKADKTIRLLKTVPPLQVDFTAAQNPTIGTIVGQSQSGRADADDEGGYAANFNFRMQYVGNDGSSATLVWNCQTGEVLQSFWSPAD